MKTERSKYIRRYLKSISDKVHTSKYFTSYHYFIGDMHIRFSDHFSAREPDIYLDIIKSNEFYIFKLQGFSYTVYPKDALTYLRSILIVGPEFLKRNNDLCTTIKRIERELNLHESGEYDKVIANNKDLKTQLHLSSNQVSSLTSKLAKANQQAQEYAKEVLDLRTKLKAEREKTTAIRNKLKSYLNELN